MTKEFPLLKRDDLTTEEPNIIPVFLFVRVPYEFISLESNDY
jgi:hypothetical protein